MKTATSELVLQASVGERRPFDVDVLLRFRMHSLLAEDEIARPNFRISAMLQSVLQLWGGGGALICDELRCIARGRFACLTLSRHTAAGSKVYRAAGGDDHGLDRKF